MKKHLITIFSGLIFLVGLSFLLYPTISDRWNSMHQSRAIASYTDVVANLTEDTTEADLEAARAYNRMLAERPLNLMVDEETEAEYRQILNPTGTGIMGYIEIPSINCSLPIYHGTDEAVLQIAVGHINGTSLPVGGESTHTVISGHRGLPSAKLFTNIDQLVPGDQFNLQVLKQTLTYEVDQIRIVLPDEINDLQIEGGKDLCTLVTCTPYGVNTHRLLVRGHRVDTTEVKEVHVTADASVISPTILLPIVLLPLLLIFLIGMLIVTRKR